MLLLVVGQQFPAIKAADDLSPGGGAEVHIRVHHLHLRDVLCQGRQEGKQQAQGKQTGQTFFHGFILHL